MNEGQLAKPCGLIFEVLGPVCCDSQPSNLFCYENSAKKRQYHIPVANG